MTKFYLKTLFISLVICCVCSSISLAQLPSNLSNVHVDDLSDDQIRQIIQEASNRGLSDAQLQALAKQRGLPANEANALQNRINSARSSGSATDNMNGATTDTMQTTRRTLNYRADSIPPNSNNNFASSLYPRVFGADIFTNANMSFAPNLRLATPPNYIVGPEDQLVVNVYGKSVASWKLEVSPEGNINLPVAGVLNVAGKTITQVSNDIKRKLIDYRFAIGNGTSVQVSLGNIRSIKVILIGNVKKPGTYTLPSLATAFNALYSAGGPNDRGTFRRIEIIRNNKIIRLLDIYDFLTKGDQKNNITLQDQDIIRVPSYQNHVQLTGEVINPAIFEVLPGETFDDVLNFAGGFTDQAYIRQIKVYQVNDQQRSITDIKQDNYKTYIPQRGDKYIVEKILNRFTNRVAINGAVFRPGNYELENGLTLSKLIDKAAGLKEDAFTGQASITRLNADNSKRVISVSLKGIIDKTAADVALQREDSVHVSSIFDLRNEYAVAIKGEVRNPGSYAYADSMTVTELIIKAGGFTEGASSKRIEVSRRKISTTLSPTEEIAVVYNIDVDPNLNFINAAFTLKPYDIISVYSTPGYEKQRTVQVEGEVQYPGLYTIRARDEKISDIIARAGNLKPLADAGGSSLKRTNVAILGANKNSIDSNVLIADRAANLRHLERSFKDTTLLNAGQARNNYIGINLDEILKKPGSITDLIVEDGDVIRVPKRQQVVSVNGEVLFPSAVVFEPGKDFKEYILSAGGYAPEALKKRAYIVYANGAVRGTKKILFFRNYPKVKPGSEIFVPQKSAPKVNTIQNTVALTTGLASLGAIILGILSLRR